MKFIIVHNLLAITPINPIVNSHENHDHQIYNWTNSKDNTKKSDSTFNGEKLEVIKNKKKTNTKRNWIRFFKR